MEKWTAGQLAAAVDRTARAGGRSTARDEALALVECVRQELGAGASVEEVAAAAVRRATPGGSNVVRVARVKGGEVVLGVNPEVLREVCRMLKAGAGNEAQSARAEYTFAVEVLDAEEAVAAEFGQAATSQLSAGHAARLVVGWIRERAATTDNKSMMPLLKKLGVVKNEQFQLQLHRLGDRNVLQRLVDHDPDKRVHRRKNFFGKFSVGQENPRRNIDLVRLLRPDRVAFQVVEPPLEL